MCTHKKKNEASTVLSKNHNSGLPVSKMATQMACMVTCIQTLPNAFGHIWHHQGPPNRFLVSVFAHIGQCDAQHLWFGNSITGTPVRGMLAGLLYLLISIKLLFSASLVWGSMYKFCSHFHIWIVYWYSYRHVYLCIWLWYIIIGALTAIVC